LINNPMNVTQMYARRIADANTKVRAGTGIIITDQSGRILLEKRSDCGWWGLPGGRIEPGESIITAALREAKEETGLTVEITQLFGVYSGPQDRIVTFPDNVVQLVDIILTARIVSGELVCSSESEKLQFFNPKELPAEIVPPARGPLQDFINGQVGVIR
jgi:8-oxo-dGTP pyrophosphatase MutT (NUDIX family)